MLNALRALAEPAVMERLTLLVNHVLASEPVAADHLRAHAGRIILLQFNDWPKLLPALPGMAFRVTPAALVEWCGPEPVADADLRVAIDASNPALALVNALGGKRPRIEVAGDAAFAGDVNWLFDNLRWDLQDDLARIVGQAPARELSRLGTMLADGLRAALDGLSGLAGRSRGAGQPPR
jgi:ubiquinone biosynthesis protein UbiJ